MINYRKCIHELIDKIHGYEGLKRIYHLVVFLYEKETP